MTPERPPLLLDDGFLRRLVTRAHFELWRARALDRMDPLDLAQDVLVDLYGLHAEGRLETTDPLALGRGLAATIAARRAIDAARRASGRREKPAGHRSERWVGTAAALDQHRAAITSSSTRIRRIDAKTRAREVLDFVARREEADPSLAGGYELLVLKHVEGLTYPEIVARRGRGESSEALRSKLRRLEEAIRREMA